MDWWQVITMCGSIILSVYLMHRESIGWWKETNKEMKDFHGRLCTLEERYLQMMQRILEKK